jgi:hypothetical protein
MTNVASFDAFNNDQQIAAHQAGLVRIVLEGDTDVKLFKRFWFPSFLETFQFIEAKLITGAAGCTGVDGAVVHSREEGIPAVGIVDRDTYFRNKQWQRLLSRDEVQITGDWINNRVYVTSRWEVEAYLLEPELLRPWVTVAHRHPPGSEDDCERALGRTLTACEALLAAIPFFTSQHQASIPAAPLPFLYDKPIGRVIQVCNAKIALSTAGSQAVAAEIQGLVAEIFVNQPADRSERLRFLLRYVDTKRLFHRLHHALKIKDATNWVQLAEFMRMGNQRPAELEQVLTSVQAELAA